LKKNSEALWSLLLFSGYLTALKTVQSGFGYRCTLTPPNEEVASLYPAIITQWFSDVLETENYHHLLKNLTEGRLGIFLRALKRFLKESMSYFDVKGHHPEKFYHGFVLGLIVGLSGTHTIQSNKESGDGRYDVMIIPKDFAQLGLILEFKVADEEVTLADAAQEALIQINQRGYEAELRQKGVQQILKIGLAFRDKEVELASLRSEAMM
jgi:hypothetical protein